MAGAADDVTRIVAVVDSPGGSLVGSTSMAADFVDPVDRSRQTITIIDGQCRGDAVLIGLAGRPLVMTEGSTIGGGGQAAISQRDLIKSQPLIDLIAQRTGRPAGLIRGLLHPELTIYRYTESRTGRVVYADPDYMASEMGNEFPNWQDAFRRGDRLSLQDGLSAAEAVELGLADDVADDSASAAIAAGLTAMPPPLVDRPLIRWVENLGGQRFLAFLLIGVAFSALSAEANSPGLGVGGFVALLCFGMFFWVNFLSGTAEWFEAITLVLGLVCIAVEIFLVPGIGVFGVGGLALLSVSIVLMSQTFIIPQNAYQIGVMSRGVWTALGGVFCLIAALAGFRYLLPSTPGFKHLVMEELDASAIDRSERMGDYEALVGRPGRTTTPIRPSGKARIGDQVLGVVSQGEMIPRDTDVRVLRVLGTRIVVVADADVS